MGHDPRRVPTLWGFPSLRAGPETAHGLRSMDRVAWSLYSRFLARAPTVTGNACMQQPDPNQRLSLIPTLWSLVYLAHHGPAEAANSARQQLLERYRGAVYRYLRK